MHPDETSDAFMCWTDEQQQEINAFRGCVIAHLYSPQCHGTRYAMEMSAQALLLLGVNPSRVTPDGYVRPLARLTPEA